MCNRTSCRIMYRAVLEVRDHLVRGRDEALRVLVRGAVELRVHEVHFLELLLQMLHSRLIT